MQYVGKSRSAAGGRLTRARGATLLGCLAAFSACSAPVGGGSAAAGSNLLRNPGFTASANGDVPDYWDLHHAAALRFANLAEVFSYDDATGPVPGARVLRIANPVDDFPYLYFLSANRSPVLPDGTYVLSFYARADRDGASLRVAPSLERLDSAVRVALTTHWQRYERVLSQHPGQAGQLSPMFWFPEKGVYRLSAPQLEVGVAPGAFTAAGNPDEESNAKALQSTMAAAARRRYAEVSSSGDRTDAAVRAQYSVYRGADQAQLSIQPRAERIRCASTPSAEIRVDREVTPAERAARRATVDIAAWPPGTYDCAVRDVTGSATGTIVVGDPAGGRVRIRRDRATLELDGRPFYMQGIMIGGAVPPEAYLRDVASHGTNTIIYQPRLSEAVSVMDADLAKVTAAATRNGLRVVVGPAVMGQKDQGWPARLDAFERLMQRHAADAAVIGWFVIDEPQAWTLARGELSSMMARARAADPTRFAFVNWGSDDVPERMGDEPPGGLAATDLYSYDYYPFQTEGTTLEEFALRTARAMGTARRAGVPANSWLQLYGYLDTRREPTAEELRFMAYVCLLEHGGYSYWQTKSTSTKTWEGVRATNTEIAGLADRFLLNPAAEELSPAHFVGDDFVSVWQAEGRRYVLVAHASRAPGTFLMANVGLPGRPPVGASALFGRGRPVAGPHGVSEVLEPFATRVYALE